MALNRRKLKFSSLLRYAALVGLTGLASTSVQSAEIQFIGNNAHGTPVVTVSGSFVSQDIERFADVTKELDSAIVSFNSSGGNLAAGIEIGTRIRLRGYRTAVANGNQCYSACALAWLGGTERFAGDSSQIGFHAAYLEEGNRLLETGLGNALVGAYANGLGFRTPAIIFLTSAPPEGLNWLTENEAQRVGISVNFRMEPALVAVPPSSVAQTAILYEENSNDPKAQAHAIAGRVYWTFDSTGPEQQASSVRATVFIPDASLNLTMTLRQNRDKTLPASHTIELLFASASKAGRTVRDVGLLQFKDEEAVRGAPVAGLPVPISDNHFLIGFSNIPKDIQRNMDLLEFRNWIDIPIRFEGGSRAIVSFEKGSSGSEAIRQMLDEEARFAELEPKAGEREALRRLLEGERDAGRAPLPILPSLQFLTPNFAPR